MWSSLPYGTGVPVMARNTFSHRSRLPIAFSHEPDKTPTKLKYTCWLTSRTYAAVNITTLKTSFNVHFKARSKSTTHEAVVAHRVLACGRELAFMLVGELVKHMDGRHKLEERTFGCLQLLGP